MGVVGGIGIMIGVRQPGQIWVVPVGQGYFAMGRIVSNECLRMQARGAQVDCPQNYGALVYLPRSRPGGYGAEYTIFAIPDPQPRR